MTAIGRRPVSPFEQPTYQITDAQYRAYLARGRRLHAAGVRDAIVGAYRALMTFGARLVATLRAAPRWRLWRVPQSGHCANC